MTVCKIQERGINIPFSSLQIEIKKMNYIMAEQNELADIMKMLEIEPAQPIVASSEAPKPDIPALREELRFWFLPANAKKQSALMSHTKK